MFSIQNKSGKYVSISDLGLVMAPKQCLDLDKVTDRYVSDGSSCLKKAVEKGMIKILRKDVELKTIVIENKSSTDIGELKKELNNMKKELMAALLENMKNNTVIIHQDVLVKSSESDSYLEDKADPVALAKLHQKTMEKMLKNTESNISSSSKEVIDSSFKNKIDELEGLM
jgi:hypothetical protein